eukprot:COSAG05_NODE_2073_length_3610_cov_1.610367_3_plen_55_part_00
MSESVHEWADHSLTVTHRVLSTAVLYDSFRIQLYMYMYKDLPSDRRRREIWIGA